MQVCTYGHRIYTMEQCQALPVHGYYSFFTPPVQYNTYTYCTRRGGGGGKSVLVASITWPGNAFNATYISPHIH